MIDNHIYAIILLCFYHNHFTITIVTKISKDIFAVDDSHKIKKNILDLC